MMTSGTPAVSTSARESHRPSLWQAWKIQSTVLGALILREMQSRYGRHNIGYLWMIAEPMLLASVVTAMHFATEGTAVNGGGLAVYPFSVLGYCVLIIFRNNFTRSEGVLEGSANLMHHSRITAFDILLSKMICESSGAIMSLLLLMGVGILTGLAQFPVRPLYVFLGTAEIFLWTFGLTLIIGSYTYGTHLLGRFVHPVAYFMFPLSGAFITMNFLPYWARPYMAWNPMMAMFETIRYGQFSNADDRYLYQGYVIANCFVALYWGLVALRHVRKHIHVG